MPRSIAVVCLFALLTGCGRPEQPAVNTPQPDVNVAAGQKDKPVAPIARHPQQKWSSELTNLDAKVAALTGDYVTKTKELLTWLKTRPEYEDSGISRIGNAWARFSDGQLVMIPFPAPGTRGSKHATTIPLPRLPQTGPVPSPRFTIPASRHARLLDPYTVDNYGGELVSPIDDHLAPWLKAAGYETIQGNASVDALRAVQGDGIFYIDSHGSSGTARGGHEVFALMTGISEFPDDPKGQAQWRADVSEGRLVNVARGRYGITHKFVKHYMSFSEGAFVFINACSSDSEPAFRQAFLDKGAAVYAGWTDSVYDVTANIVAKYYFDRLVGKNVFSWDPSKPKEPKIEPETPKQRPFDFASLFHGMQERNLDVDHLDGGFYDPRSSIPLVNEPLLLSEKEVKVLATAGVPQDVIDKLRDLVNRTMSLAALEKALRERLTNRELALYAGAILNPMGYSNPRMGLPCQLRVHYSDKVLPPHTGLTPSLISVYLMPNDTEEELMLNGQFGTGTPRVTVAGVPVEVKRWEGKSKEEGMGMVVCSLPQKGPGSAGDVVISIDGRVSNPVPLTEWHVSVRFTQERTGVTPPLKVTGTIDLHFRADIHSYRAIPHETPRSDSVQILASLDSQMQWQLSGKGHFKDTPTAAIEWTGSGKMVRKKAREPDAPGGFDVIGQLDTQKKSIRFSSFWIMVNKGGTETQTGLGGKSTTSDTGFLIHENDVRMALDDKFGIVKGEHVWSDDFRKTKLEWDAAPALHPPTADTISYLKERTASGFISRLIK